MFTPRARIVAIAAKHRLLLMVDEIYDQVLYDAAKFEPVAPLAGDVPCLTFSGLSKVHRACGWRIGWAVAPEPLAERLARFGGATLFGCSQFIQDAAAYALRHDDVYVEKMRLEYQARRDFVVERINAMPRLACDTPDAGMFVMMNTSATGLDGQRFAEALLIVAKQRNGPTGDVKLTFDHQSTCFKNYSPLAADGYAPSYGGDAPF